MLIIGLTGKAYSGKDTAAKILCELLPNSKCFSFAKLLKEECSIATGIKLKDFDNPETKEFLRPLMQWWGDLRKNEYYGGYQDYWTDNCINQIYHPAHKIDYAIITDVRYNFEAERIKKEGGTVIKIVGENQLKETPNSSHSSENGIMDKYIDIRVINDQSSGIELLYKTISHIVPNITNESKTPVCV